MNKEINLEKNCLCKIDRLFFFLLIFVKKDLFWKDSDNFVQSLKIPIRLSHFNMTQKRKEFIFGD